jgi:predicted nucleic acid-binding protein
VRYHLDTSFLIDWEREEQRTTTVHEEILQRLHVVSVDPIVETEFFASFRAGRQAQAVFGTVLIIGTRVTITPQASRMAAVWLAPMDRVQRRARFADAIVAAVAFLEGATLITSDTGMRSFPVPVLLY